MPPLPPAPPGSSPDDRQGHGTRRRNHRDHDRRTRIGERAGGDEQRRRGPRGRAPVSRNPRSPEQAADDGRTRDEEGR
jgi:hypothetical protein